MPTTKADKWQVGSAKDVEKLKETIAEIPAGSTAESVKTEYTGTFRKANKTLEASSTSLESADEKELGDTLQTTKDNVDAVHKAMKDWKKLAIALRK